jgi:hypothetical protein
MGQTVLDQDIIPIGNLPRLESECEEAIPDQFPVILDRCQDQLTDDQMEKLKGLISLCDGIVTFSMTSMTHLV